MVLTEQSIDPELSEACDWKCLKSMTVINCGVALFDESMHFFPVLQEMNVSHNDISQIIHLQDCFHLFDLNLSNNRIKVLSNISLVLGNVVKLNLSYNHICSLDGLDKLYSLEYLDLSGNCLDDFLEMSYIRKLPCLDVIYLQKNPISTKLQYR
jgi:Leucine-rich repeat (LRR) protein